MAVQNLPNMFFCSNALVVLIATATATTASPEPVSDFVAHLLSQMT